MWKGSRGTTLIGAWPTRSGTSRVLRLYTRPPLTGRCPVESTLPVIKHFGQRLQRDYSVALPPPFPPAGASLLRCLPPTRLYHSLYAVGYKITQNKAVVNSGLDL